MAQNFFLFLDGIIGDVIVNGLENSIECNALYHEMARPPGAGTTGETRTRSSTAHGDISIVKRIDRASVKLIEACNLGQVITNGRIEFHGSSGQSNATKYYEIVLTDILVTSVRTEQLNNLFPDSSDTPIIERVTLAYGRIEWKFVTQAADGSAGPTIKTSWVLEANTTS